MTTQEKLEVIRAACIKANPSIMELGFGCEVKHTKVDQQWVVLVAQSDGSVVCWHKKWDKLETPYYTHKSVLEILGRPIRLADIFQVVFDILPEATEKNQKENINILLKVPTYWNLLKDDIRDQSGECIEFLYQLLKYPPHDQPYREEVL